MKPNKTLGQNFLICKNIVEDIIKSAEIKPSDFILEVGPGKGALTEALVKAAPKGKVVATEKDPRMVEFLKEQFSTAKNLEIIEGDILEMFPSSELKTQNYKVVANIPYYLTSHLIRVFLEAKKQPELMVLMVQKEVAERVVAKDGKESLLSISVKAYGEPKITKKVPASCFYPKPNVDSAVLKISGINKKNFGKTTEKDFFETLKRGFAHKRKLLASNLSAPKDIFEKCGLPTNIRAEKLSPKDWFCIVQHSK